MVFDASNAVQPVLYLDIDGVLWDFRRANDGPDAAARGIGPFMDLALSNFEVRWLTYWAPRGPMSSDALSRLPEHTGIGRDIWAQVLPALPFSGSKASGIDWDEYQAGRPFWWIDDDPSPIDLEILAANRATDRLLRIDVLSDADALIDVIPRLHGLSTSGDVPD